MSTCLRYLDPSCPVWGYHWPVYRFKDTLRGSRDCNSVNSVYLNQAVNNEVTEHISPNLSAWPYTHTNIFPFVLEKCLWASNSWLGNCFCLRESRGFSEITCISSVLLFQGNRCYWGAQGERKSAGDLQTSCGFFIWGLFPSNLWGEQMDPLTMLSSPQTIIQSLKRTMVDF